MGDLGPSSECWKGKTGKSFQVRISGIFFFFFQSDSSLFFVRVSSVMRREEKLMNKLINRLSYSSL